MGDVESVLHVLRWPSKLRKYLKLACTALQGMRMRAWGRRGWRGRWWWAATTPPPTSPCQACPTGMRSLSKEM